MKFTTKAWAQTQFQNFANKIASVFAKKTDIPSVGNGTLTVQKNGANVQTFTANQSGNVTANITVPTSAADVGAVATTKVLTTKEQINANTDTSNVAGATAVKEMFGEISSNLGEYTYIPFNGTTAITGEETRITNLPNTNFTPGRYIIFAKTHIKEVAVYSALFGMLTFNEACGCGFYVFANTETWNIELRVTQYSGHGVAFDNAYGSGLHIVKIASL